MNDITNNTTLKNGTVVKSSNPEALKQVLKDYKIENYKDIAKLI